MIAGYFDLGMVNRQRLLWTIATRRQLEGWEPFVAAAVARSLERRELVGHDDLMTTTARTYTHVLVDGAELEYERMLS